MQFHEKKKKRVIINITSLIDVLFLLLIFFMVSSTFIEKPAMKLDLPKTSQKKTSRVENYSLFITRDEKIFLNQKEVNLSNLQPQLESIKDEIDTEGIVLQADEDIRYGLVIEVMDIIKTAGIQKLIVATESRESE